MGRERWEERSDQTLKLKCLPVMTAGGVKREPLSVEQFPKHPSQSQDVLSYHLRVPPTPLFSTSRLQSIFHHVSHSCAPDAALAALLQPHPCECQTPDSLGGDHTIGFG